MAPREKSSVLGDFRKERGHMTTALEMLARDMGGMELLGNKDRMREAVMQSENRRDQLLGLQYFRRMLCEDGNPHVQQIVQLGLIPHFVEALKADDCPELQVEAAWALTNVSAGSTEDTSAVVEGGGMQILVELMKTKSKDLKEQAIWAVGNIAVEMEFRDHLVKNCALDRLADTLQSDMTAPSTRRIGTWALANFVRHPMQRIDPKIKPDEFFRIVCTLKHLMANSDPEVVVDACWAVSSLTCWGDHAVVSLLMHGVGELLIRLLCDRSQYSSIHLPVLKSLAQIAAGPEEHTNELLSCKSLLPRVGELLKAPHSKKVIGNALWLIANVAGDNYKQVRELLNARILPKLVNFVKCGMFELKQEAGPALAYIFMTKDLPHSAWSYLMGEEEIGALCSILTWESKLQIKRALEGLEMALHAADKYRMDGKDQCFLNESYAVSGNSSITKKRVRVKDRNGRPAKSNAVAEYIKACQGHYTLFQLQDHDDKKVGTLAGMILNKYFQEEVAILEDPRQNNENGSNEPIDVDGFGGDGATVDATDNFDMDNKMGDVDDISTTMERGCRISETKSVKEDIAREEIGAVRPICQD